MYITSHKTVEIVWEIKGFQNYGFGNDKKLYNLKTGRSKKQTINNCRIGYWIGKRFLSINQLRSILIRPHYYKCPF